MFATPGTPSSRCRIVQYASIDRSITDLSFEVMPTFMIRLVEDNGGIMKGGAAHVGRLLVASAIRSLTSCRARISSAPGLKISRIDDSCGTDFDRITSTPGTPLSAFSSGTV